SRSRNGPAMSFSLVSASPAGGGQAVQKPLDIDRAVVEVGRHPDQPLSPRAVDGPLIQLAGERGAVDSGRTGEGEQAGALRRPARATHRMAPPLQLRC